MTRSNIGDGLTDCLAGWLAGWRLSGERSGRINRSSPLGFRIGTETEDDYDDDDDDVVNGKTEFVQKLHTFRRRRRRSR